MKRILFFLLFLPSLAFAQLELPYSIKVNNPKPLDYYYYESDGTPYDDTDEVKSAIPSGVRYQGMTINVVGVEYWFGDGTDDSDLEVKIVTSLPFSSITDTPTTLSGYGITDAWKTRGLIKIGTVNSFPNSIDITPVDPTDVVEGSMSFGNDSAFYNFNIYARTFTLASILSATERAYLLLSEDATLKVENQPSTELRLYRGPGSNNQEISFTSSGMIVKDVIQSRGLGYTADYSTNGISNYGNRWIPDYGAVKSYADAKVAASITNGVTTSAPNQDQVFDALALKTTTALTASTGTAVAFDLPRLYGTDASPVTGNITMNATGAIVGMVQTMIHNDSSEPTFGAEFHVSGTYTTGVDNLIMFLCTGTGDVWVTITKAD